MSLTDNNLSFLGLLLQHVGGVVVAHDNLDLGVLGGDLLSLGLVADHCSDLILGVRLAKGIENISADEASSSGPASGQMHTVHPLMRIRVGLTYKKILVIVMIEWR